MNAKGQKGSVGVYVLIVLAWIAAAISLPIYFLILMGMGMSAGSAHATFAELALLAVCPLIVTIAIVSVFIRRKVTRARFVSLLLPGVLSLAELVFTFLVWMDR